MGTSKGTELLASVIEPLLSLCLAPQSHSGKTDQGGDRVIVRHLTTYLSGADGSRSRQKGNLRFLTPFLWLKQRKGRCGEPHGEAA